MSGNSGKLGDAVLKSVGYSRDKCYATNLCCYTSAPDASDIAACRGRFSEELKSLRPSVILALGVEAIQRFSGGLQASKVRGSVMWNTEFDCWVISSFQPAAAFQAADVIADLVRDFAKIEMFIGRDKDCGKVEYTLIGDPVRARSVLKEVAYGYHASIVKPFVALDVETKPNPAQRNTYFDELRCFGISINGDATWVFTEKALRGLTVDDWTPMAWVFHNAGFDTEMVKIDQHVVLDIAEDTMLMSYSLDERGGGTDEGSVDRGVGIHGLKRLSREYEGADFYDVNTWSATDEQLWPYNAKDAAYTARLARRFYDRQVAEEGTREMYLRMLKPMVEIVREEKSYGVYCNPEALKALAIDWGHKWLNMERELVEEAKAFGWPDGDINLNSPVQKKRFLNTYLGLGVPDTKADTLKKHKAHPWVAKYQSWIRLDRMLNNYVLNLIPLLDERGYCHPDAYIHGTRTGRWSYHRPPLQTWPTGFQYYDPDDSSEELAAEIEEYIKLRSLLGAPKGKVYIAADLEQAELWCMALESGDENMLADLRTGDFHSTAAERMFLVDRKDFGKDGWAQMRRESKYVTFGMAYGRGAKSLKEPGEGQQGQLDKYTLAECEQFVKRWHGRYDAHYKWWQGKQRDGRLHGELVSPSGRRRRINNAPLYGGHYAPMVANWPIQTTSHDHVVLAHQELWQLWESGESPARPLWEGHDALYFECDNDYEAIAKACEIISAALSRPRYFAEGIPVEVKVGPNWTDSADWNLIQHPEKRKPDFKFNPEWFTNLPDHLRPQLQAAS